MSEQKRIPFDLDKFKAGMMAKWGKQLIKYTYTATNGFICFEHEAGDPSYSALEHLIKAATMVSRHQALIESYNPEDTWQVKGCDSDWIIVKPEWNEDDDYRLHPHNDLIKAWKRGAKIEVRMPSRSWGDCTKPAWYEDVQYRIKPEPVIHCLAYDAKRFDHEQTTAVRARVVKKEVAQANGWKIIQEWEV